MLLYSCKEELQMIKKNLGYLLLLVTVLLLVHQVMLRITTIEIEDKLDNIIEHMEENNGN